MKLYLGHTSALWPNKRCRMVFPGFARLQSMINDERKGESADVGIDLHGKPKLPGAIPAT